MIKAGFDFDFGLIVTVITIAFAGINAIISKNNKKNRENRDNSDNRARDLYSEDVIEQKSVKSDLDELKEMFGFSSVIDSLVKEPVIEEPEKSNEIDFQEEIKEHFKNVSYESIEAPAQKEFIVDRIEEDGTDTVEEILVETCDKKDKKMLAFKQMLKENPKMLIFCSEILKPKYQDF